MKILDLIPLLGGMYLIAREHDQFYGSRVEMLEYLSTCGYSDTEIQGIVQIMDSLPIVYQVGNRQAFG